MGTGSGVAMARTLLDEVFQDFALITIEHAISPCRAMTPTGERITARPIFPNLQKDRCKRGLIISRKQLKAGEAIRSGPTKIDFEPYAS